MSAHDDEIQSHIDLYTDELIARGRTPDAARREARLRFGNPRARQEELEDMRRLPIVETLTRDLRHAWRSLKRTPAFTVTAVLTLALAIGGCTAIFSLADAILLRPLPFPEPDRLAFITGSVRSPRGEGTQTAVDGATWEAVRDHVPSVDAAVMGAGGGGANLVVGTTAAFVRQERVSHGFFRVLGVAPMYGREFERGEDVPGGPALTVLAYEMWQRYFGGNLDIIGKSILLRGEPHTVVGVMPPGFRSTNIADLWTPLRATTAGEGGGTNLQIIARLRPAATWSQVATELGSVHDEAFRLFEPREDVTRWLGVRPLQDALVQGVREPIVMLGWAVGAVLLVACVNLAALLLARGGTRAKEVATRMALGSGRAAVARQLMVEAVALALAGGVLGVFVGYVGLQALQAVGGDTFEDWSRVSLDGRALLAAIGMSFLTSLIFGLAPALHATRLDVQAALSDGGSRAIAGGSRRWPRRLLVIFEVAAGVTLLVSAGLLMRTFVNLRSLDPGFNPEGLTTASVSLQDARYRTADQANALFTETLTRLRATPGVEAAAISLEMPYERLLNLGFRFMDDGSTDTRVANVSYITPEFLAAMGIPLLDGRDLSDTDTAASVPVVIVNESFARVYSRDRPILGRRLRMSGVERQVVGVAGNVQQRASFLVDGITPGPLMSLPLVFLPAAQGNDGLFRTAHTWFSPVWLVRARSAGEGQRAIHQAIAAVDPQLPVSQSLDMAAVMARATSSQRLMMTLVGALAVAAVLLAAIGIHGLIAQSVAERQREFGIRMALGATARHLTGRVMAGGLALAAIGLLLGAALSRVAVQLVESFLWSVTDRDPMTYVGVAVVLVAVSFLASALPALKIFRLDPARSLRS